MYIEPTLETFRVYGIVQNEIRPNLRLKGVVKHFVQWRMQTVWVSKNV